MRSAQFPYRKTSPTETSLLRALIASLAVTLLGGCGASKSSVPEFQFRETDYSNHNSQEVIDAGIVFVDEMSYLCVPLERFGIADSDEVLSVKSSCECTRPSIVQFDSTNRQHARALRINFSPEPNAETLTVVSKTAPANLSVKISFQLSEGRDASAIIQFLHTTLIR